MKSKLTFILLFSFLLFSCNQEESISEPITFEPYLVVGDIPIYRVVESEGAMMMPSTFYKGVHDRAILQHKDKLFPTYIDSTGRMVFSIQTFIVKVDDQIILIGTGVGNGRETGDPNYFNMLENVGVSADEVDIVLATHFHADHIGWHTKIVNGRVVPSFPNARYILHNDEWEYWMHKQPASDMIQPVLDQAEVEFIDGMHRVNDHMVIMGSPGHTPGHTTIILSSNGEEAVFCGDIIHHAVQILQPGWESVFTIDTEQAKETRMKFFNEFADKNVWILPSHFPTYIKIVRLGNEGWDFIDKYEECFEEETVFMVVEDMPMFPGGEDSLKKYLANNYKYPALAIDNGIEGSIFISFVVGKTGKICNVKILKGLCKPCDAEAIRIVKEMPNWNPGKHKGKPVAVRYNMPIRLSLKR